MTAVVTELTIDPTEAEQGASSFSLAMARAAQASNDNLKSIADSTAALNKQIAGLGPATAAATEASGSSFGSFVTKLALGAAAAAIGVGAIYTAFKVLYEIVTVVPKALAEAWDLGNQKLAEYVDLSAKAVASGLSTDFYQRITKASAEAGVSTDNLTAALKRLNDATADVLGGTSAQQRLKALTDAGNFSGNTGVSQLTGATTTEDRFRAIVSLIDQAISKGERLAALDVAKTFLGDAVAGNLAKDSQYLDKMIAGADAIKATDLIPQSQIDNAVNLQNRLDAAEKILSERWHPIQDILTAGGIAMKEAWVNIVESVASAFDGVVKLVAALGQVPGWFVALVNGSGIPSFIQGKLDSFGAAVTNAISPASRSSADAYYGIQHIAAADVPAATALPAAREALGSALGNPANLAAARDQSNSIENALRPDTSKDPNAKTVEDSTGAYDRASEALIKYIEVSNASAKSIDANAYEQEKLKAIAELTAGGIKDGLTPAAAAAKAEMSGLTDKAAAAAESLAKAKVASSIDYAGKTTLLSADDVAIANQLKGIYGKDVPAALDSTEAAAIRLNNAFKSVGSAIDTNLTSGLTDIVSGTKSVSSAFQSMESAIVKAIENMIIKITIVEPLMRSLQSAATGLGLGSGGIGSLLGGAGVTYGAAGTAGSNLYGPVAPSIGLHAGGIVGSEATFARYIHPAYFDDAPRFHTGGIAGDEVPIIAKRGEGVFTPGQMAALGGGSGSSQPPVVNVHNNTGQAADASARIGPNGSLEVTLDKAIDASVGKSLSSGTGMRVLNNQYGVKPFTGL